MSLETLSEAIARGEEVVFKVKYDNAVSPYHYLHDGLLNVSKTAVTFRGSFTVSPDGILKLTYRAGEAPHIILRVVVKDARGFFGHSWKGKKDFYFYNPNALTVGDGPGGTGLAIQCNGCDDSMSMLYALLKKVHDRSK
jgi:hypothetical protein